MKTHDESEAMKHSRSTGENGIRNSFTRVPWNCGLVLVMALFFGGCADSADYAQEVKQFSASLAAEIDASSRTMVAVNGEQSEGMGIKFAEACHQAAANDKEIAGILTELAKAGIDFDGVRSSLLPRLNMAANAEVPLKNSDDAESDLTGGIFVEYDIWRALAVGDETVLRRTLAEKYLYQIWLNTQKIQQKLLQLHRRAAMLRQSLDKKGQALALAEKGSVLAKVYVEHQQRPPAILLEWQGRRDGLQMELEKMRAEEKNVHHELKDLLGLADSREVVLSDGEEVLAGQAEMPADSLTSAGVWGRHYEARLYELELVAAEVAVNLVKIDRLPKVNVTLGLGKIPLEADEGETAATLMRFSVSMPLWDTGDYQRKYAKSLVVRDNVKKAMNNKVAQMWNRVRLAENGCAVAKAKLANLESAIRMSRQRINAEEMLTAKAKVDGLAVVQQKMELADLEMRHQEAIAELGEAKDNLRLAAGVEPVPGTGNMVIEKLTDRTWH